MKHLAWLAARARVPACCLLVLMTISACATSPALTVARDQFKQGSTAGALDTLSTAEVSHRDRLLLLLDKALVAQAAGNHELSIVAFEDAYQLIDKLDYVSLQDQSAALATSDWAIRYSGEFSERLWIHTFQMINYLMLDQPAGAAVEARRAVELYQRHGDVLNNDLFTRYLMVLSFDAAGQHDSAKVVYRKLLSQFDKTPPWQPGSRSRELVLLVATGFIEPKLPGDLIVDIDARISFPYYPEVVDRAPRVEVLDKAKVLPSSQVDTRLLTVARSALAKRGKRIAARQAMRLAAKYSLSASIEDQDPLAGAIARLFLFAIEQADTRSWETLPAYLTLVKVSVPDNTQTVEIVIDDKSQGVASRLNQSLHIVLSKQKRQFHMIRTGMTSDPVSLLD